MNMPVTAGNLVRAKGANLGTGTVLRVSPAGRLLVRWSQPESGMTNPQWLPKSRVRRLAT